MRVEFINKKAPGVPGAFRALRLGGGNDQKLRCTRKLTEAVPTLP
jgi:hypothetical protein